MKAKQVFDSIEGFLRENIPARDNRVHIVRFHDSVVVEVIWHNDGVAKCISAPYVVRLDGIGGIEIVTWLRHEVIDAAAIEEWEVPEIIGVLKNMWGEVYPLVDVCDSIESVVSSISAEITAEFGEKTENGIVLPPMVDRALCILKEIVWRSWRVFNRNGIWPSKKERDESIVYILESADECIRSLICARGKEPGSDAPERTLAEAVNAWACIMSQAC